MDFTLKWIFCLTNSYFERFPKSSGCYSAFHEDGICLATEEGISEVKLDWTMFFKLECTQVDREEGPELVVFGFSPCNVQRSLFKVSAFLVILDQYKYQYGTSVEKRDWGELTSARWNVYVERSAFAVVFSYVWIFTHMPSFIEIGGPHLLTNQKNLDPQCGATMLLKCSYSRPSWLEPFVSNRCLCFFT